ncbi:17401_t:CDS:1 [Racocetra persica]|uniref:17401_t:CDS:1 n=1 Tax=Racocetra persica TaxID=160502 RepID=A0ACA9KDF0_9GLOM|nr:17401_t:CDS:1 [Racocetra persica]
MQIIDKTFKKFEQAKETFKKAKAEKTFKKAEDEYLEILESLFKVACASDDYEKVFKFLKVIQYEGNNFTKSQVKHKIEMHLLGGFGYKQNIVKARQLVQEASNLGLTSANV